MTKKKQAIWDGNVRDAALTILLAVDKNQAYSNLLLHKTIEKYKIEAKDRALLTEITYGTLQHKLTLDYYLAPFLKTKVEDWVRWLLRLSLFQMHYLTRIPPHAAVNEAVEIAKRRGHKGIASMVNGVLRSVLRQGVRETSLIENDVERLAIETSHPQWMIERFVANYGLEQTKHIAEYNNMPAMQTVRINTLHATRKEVIESLQNEGLIVTESEFLPECVTITGGQAARTEAFKRGYITIQDESSMLPATVLNPQPGMRVLDMCAAPGGKTTHIAEKMNNEGSIIALDLHVHKLPLIEEQTARLHIDIVQTAPLDARKAGETLAKESFDAILVDAPCSGLGVMRRKPDIKYTKKEQDFAQLQSIQLAILDNAAELLKPNGRLVYSTCTIDRRENEETVQAFLAAHPQMELQPLEHLPEQLAQHAQLGMLQVFPQYMNSDGFFVALFVKKEIK